jgi:hypothetical protein
MNFEFDAAGAHRPNKFEQWISKSTPLAPIAQNEKKPGFRNRRRWRK